MRLPVQEQYETKLYVFTWVNKTSGSDVAPTTVTLEVPGVASAQAVSAPVDVSQAKSIHVEIDTKTLTDHVATSIDINVYGGATTAIRQLTRWTGADAVTADAIQPLAVTVGPSCLWLLLDHNAGGRADVIARVYVRF